MSYYVDLDNDLGDEADAFQSSRWKPKRSNRARRRDTVDHYPTSDAAAKELIESLGTYEWETHKVSGRWSTAPYSLSAKIGGRDHVIHLPGRFGTTLTWLKDRLDAPVGASS